LVVNPDNVKLLPVGTVNPPVAVVTADPFPKLIDVAVVPPIVRLPAVSVSISDANPPNTLSLPAFVKSNFVVPDDDASIMSPTEFAWFTINAPLFPIPPVMNNGAFGDTAVPPISTPDWYVEVSNIVPLPFAASERFELLVFVVISGVFPPANVNTPVGDMLLLPVKNCMFPFVPLLVDTNVNVPDDALPPLIVADPPNVNVVVAPKLNAGAVVMVASPLSVSVVAPDNVSVDPDVIVFPVNERFPVPRSSIPTFEIFFPPAAILLPNVMFPVVLPPSVKLFKLSAWILPPPLNANPVDPTPLCAEILATGVRVPATPVNANFALVVAVDPSNRSSVVLIGSTAPLFSCQ